MRKIKRKSLEFRAKKTLSIGCIKCGQSIDKSEHYIKIKGNLSNKMYNVHSRCIRLGR